jgi:hypothetical protein
MTPDEHARLAVKRTVDPAAHEVYLEGRFYLNQYSSEASRKALALFQSAIAIDPSFAQAHAGLADAYATLALCCISTAEAMPRSRAAAMKALELDPQLAAAHSAIATCARPTTGRGAQSAHPRHRAQSEQVTSQNYVSHLQGVRRGHHGFARARAIDRCLPSWHDVVWPLFEGRAWQPSLQRAFGQWIRRVAQPT